MPVCKVVKDIMVDISKYPHISSGSSLKSAMLMIKNSLLIDSGYIKPTIILAFDDNKLVGTLELKDILRGLEPDFLKASTKRGYINSSAELSLIWEALFNRDFKETVEKSVSEIMQPIGVVVDPDDLLLKAAHIFIHNDLTVMPVVRSQKKVMGLIRITEVFNAISRTALAGESIGNLMDRPRFDLEEKYKPNLRFPYTTFMPGIYSKN